MPADLRKVHERNDEALERIDIGRRIKNDTERLEKLFELYTQMTARQAQQKEAGQKKPGKAQNQTVRCMTAREISAPISKASNLKLLAPLSPVLRGEGPGVRG